jgi:hypothetical protein
MKRISTVLLILVLIGFLIFPIQIFAQVRSSNLPLVVFKTEQAIVDEPKVVGQMKGNGQRKIAHPRLKAGDEPAFFYKVSNLWVTLGLFHL